MKSSRSFLFEQIYSKDLWSQGPIDGSRLVPRSFGDQSGNTWRGPLDRFCKGNFQSITLGRLETGVMVVDPMVYDWPVAVTSLLSGMRCTCTSTEKER